MSFTRSITRPSSPRVRTTLEARRILPDLELTAERGGDIGEDEVGPQLLLRHVGRQRAHRGNLAPASPTTRRRGARRPPPVFVDPPFAGGELVVGGDAAHPTLIVSYGQVGYVFERVR